MIVYESPVQNSKISSIEQNSSISDKLLLYKARFFLEKLRLRFALSPHYPEEKLQDDGGCDEDGKDVGDDEVEIHLFDLLEDDVNELE